MLSDIITCNEKKKENKKNEKNETMSMHNLQVLIFMSDDDIIELIMSFRKSAYVCCALCGISLADRMHRIIESKTVFD